MEDSRTKNASRNVLFGLINRVTVLLLPFITRTLLLYLMGTESVGLSTLFTSVLSFLSLAELGFGQAVVYSMYKPVAEKNTGALCALLRYYKRLYRIIGLVILAVGIAIMPFLPYLIQDSDKVSVNIYYLYLIYLINTIISYFFAGYRQSLLLANQRSDIRDKIALVVTVTVRLAEVAVICLTQNLYLYAGVAIIGTVITNAVTAAVTKKMYPEIVCSGEVDDGLRGDIRKKLIGLFGTKLNSIIVHQADTLVISSFLGLTLLTQYGNYYYILNTVSGFVMIVFSSLTASIGNKIATDTKDNIYLLFLKINFINNWMVGWSTICLVCLYQPFMIIWGTNDLTLPFTMSLLMAAYFYIYQIQRTILVFKDAAGLWYEDRLRPYISMVLNIVSNIILVQIIGIYGIVISTILSFSISVPWCNHVVFKKIFSRNPAKNLIKMLINSVITVLTGALCFYVCSFIPVSLWGLALKFAVCLILPNAVYFLIYHKDDAFKSILKDADGFFRRKKRENH